MVYNMDIFSIEDDKFLTFERKEGWDEKFDLAKALEVDTVDAVRPVIFYLYEKYKYQSKIYCAMELLCLGALGVSDQYNLHKIKNEIQIWLLRSRK